MLVQFLSFFSHLDGQSFFFRSLLDGQLEPAPTGSVLERVHCRTVSVIKNFDWLILVNNCESCEIYVAV